MIKEFLSLFLRATLETEGDSITINLVLFYIDILIQCFDKSLVYIIHLFCFIILISYNRQDTQIINNFDYRLRKYRLF